MAEQLRGPRFDSQHPHGSSKITYNSSTQGSDALFWFPEAPSCMWEETYAQTHTHIHKTKRTEGSTEKVGGSRAVEKLLDPAAGRVPRLPEVTSSAYPTP